MGVHALVQAGSLGCAHAATIGSKTAFLPFGNGPQRSGPTSPWDVCDSAGRSGLRSAVVSMGESTGRYDSIPARNRPHWRILRAMVPRALQLGLSERLQRGQHHAE
jgi:hypothetical protein